MLKAVILDMDGVLIDSEELHTNAVTQVLKNMGIDPGKVLEKHRVGAKSYDKTWRSLKEELHISLPLDEIIQRQYSFSYEYFNSLNLKEIDGATDFILQLKSKGFSIAVGSSAPVKLIRIILDKLNLTPHIDTFCGVEYVQSPKPDPDIYLWLSDKLKVKASECLVIEDSPSGISAAKAAGMKCLALNSSHLPKKELEPADMIVSRFSEISFDAISLLFT